MTYVKSVTVSPSSATIKKGKWYYDARATISSDCPKCACVCWHSEDTSIASVGATTGYIYGVSAGTTRVYAEATDGSGKKDYITVTVTEPVTGISIDSTSLTMGVGDLEYLDATVYPLNATNKTVTWTSSNTSVATVNPIGGVRAKKEGTTTITARTADGGFQASCTVTVLKETVIILKDGNYNKVEFCKTGKVWLCINHDMIFDENNKNSYLTYTLNERANHNLLLNYGRDDYDSIGRPKKEYTDDEIKLLYAIDPYGVAYYVKSYADELNGTLEDRIAYKDEIFTLLFGREPKYFARELNGTWHEVVSYNEINDVLSESEAYFGTHPIYDLNTFFEFVGVFSSIFDMIFSTSFFDIEDEDEDKLVDKIYKTAVLVVSGTEAFFKNELLSFAFNEALETAFENTSLEWAPAFVSLYSDLDDLAAAICPDLNYNKKIIDYCACQTGYNVLFELSDGTLHRLRDLCEMLD